MNGYHMYTSQKKWLTFGGDQVPDTDSGSLIHFPHHRWIGDFRRFITISDTLAGRLLQYHYQYLAKWLTLTTEWIHYILGAIRQTLGSGLPSTNRSNPGSLLVDILALVEVCALWVRSSYWMWLVSSPHHSILYVIDLWTWSVLLRNTSTWLWTTKLFKWISLDQRKFRTVFVIWMWWKGTCTTLACLGLQLSVDLAITFVILDTLNIFLIDWLIDIHVNMNDLPVDWNKSGLILWNVRMQLLWTL